MAAPNQRDPGGLRITDVRKSFGGIRVLDDVSIDVAKGEFLTILGASGSGKTTLLKLVAGFETVDSGTIRVSGADITGLPPAKRNVGMVFQHYALFPHMTVFQNVAFPLRTRRMRRREIQARVEEVLALVELGAFAERRPGQLSGGQQQRVALARALVYQPDLLLLDEPFGALDRKLRETMQLQVRALQRRIGVTTVFITHDQEEALVMSDRIAVFGAGRVEQLGRPREVYDQPRNRAVADFIGESNLLSGVVESGPEGRCLRLASGALLPCRDAAPDGSRVEAMLRPERLRLTREIEHGGFGARVDEAIFLGVATKYRISLEDGTALIARVPEGGETFEPGERIGARPLDGAVRMVL